MMIVDKHCSHVFCDEFPVPQIDRKSKQANEQCQKKIICNQYGEKHAVLNTENIKICGRITKLEGIKCNMFAFSSMCAEYLQKIWIFNFPR